MAMFVRTVKILSMFARTVIFVAMFVRTVKAMAMSVRMATGVTTNGNPRVHGSHILIRDPGLTKSGSPGAKTINVFRACLGAQLTICAQK